MDSNPYCPINGNDAIYSPVINALIKGLVLITVEVYVNLTLGVSCRGMIERQLLLSH